MNRHLVISLVIGLSIGLAQADWPKESERLTRTEQVKVEQSLQANVMATEASLAPGELLEIQVKDLPAETAVASFALGHGIHGLLMRPQPDGSWKGRFAVLPSLAGKTLEPMVTIRLADGSEATRILPPRRVKSVDTRDGDGFVARADGEVMFVFDKTIQMDTVVVETTNGKAIERPHYENNYFVLQGVESGEIEEIRATSIHGEQLLITPQG
jgi:hypothetical protein